MSACWANFTPCFLCLRFLGECFVLVFKELSFLKHDSMLAWVQSTATLRGHFSSDRQNQNAVPPGQWQCSCDRWMVGGSYLCREESGSAYQSVLEPWPAVHVQDPFPLSITSTCNMVSTHGVLLLLSPVEILNHTCTKPCSMHTHISMRLFFSPRWPDSDIFEMSGNVPVPQELGWQTSNVDNENTQKKVWILSLVPQVMSQCGVWENQISYPKYQIWSAAGWASCWEDHRDDHSTSPAR